MELTWPRRLASLLGVGVRNYGTAGFGPGQELLVLKEYVLARRPRLVVVGFFAGNDLQDAERFEAKQRGGASPSSALGWKFKPVIARFDQLYAMSLYQGLGRLGSGRGSLPRAASPVAADDYSGDDPAALAPPGPGFDRGLFTVPLGGRALRFAFLPPYLNCLQLSRDELQTSRRWEVTQRSYREMARLVRAQGGELVVMLVPSKAQVYLPLLQASFSAEELRQNLAFCLRQQPYAPGPEKMLRNRLALNELLRDFCAAEGIAFLDLTPELRVEDPDRAQRVLPRRLALECGGARDGRGRARQVRKGARAVIGRVPKSWGGPPSGPAAGWARCCGSRVARESEGGAGSRRAPRTAAARSRRRAGRSAGPPR